MREFIVDTKKLPNKMIKEIGYGLGGHEVELEKEVESRGKMRLVPNLSCFCKMQVFDNTALPKFFIRINIHEDFINPWDGNMNEGQIVSYTNSTGKDYDRYVEVKEPVFSRYLKFLVTRQQLHYRLAMREYLDNVR